MAVPSERVDEILDRWSRSEGEGSGEGGVEGGPLDSYLDLARFVLIHGLREPGQGEPSTHELDRLLASVARADRRADRSISSTLTRFGTLSAAVLSLASTEDVSEEALAILRAANRVDALLHRSLSRLVRILEESAERTRREHAGAMTAMMDMLSHELDNRLGAARTATDMLDNPRIQLGEGDLERVSQLVRSSLDDALRTVDDVRALVGSWGKEGGIASGRSVALPVLLRKVVDELDAVAAGAGVRLELPSEPVDAAVDAARMRLILYNLVSNGIKYHDSSEDPPRVRIDSERLDDGRIRIRISDNGIGIEESEHDNIFLYRVRIDDEVDGSGLGLAIAQEAADQLGASLEVDSRPGQGSVFTMTFRPET